MKNIRILILLLILIAVASNAYHERAAARSWNSTLQISVFPINGDGSAVAAARIAQLKDEDFNEIEVFLTAQAQRYGVQTILPVRVRLQSELKTPPPLPPVAPTTLDVILWSLKMRWWAWHQPEGVPHAHTRAFVVYWDSEATGGRAPNSHGLSKGLIAVSNVHSVARMQRTNNVVITHEILHTLGATDKYDPVTLMPNNPEGLAEPGRQPLYPQTRCEIMAGRIARSPTELEMPETLDQCDIGSLTAREIGLLAK